MRSFDLATIAVHGVGRPQEATGSILTPIYQSTTYARESLGEEPEHSYSRASNPTVSALERALGRLEDADDALCFGTGMAAMTTLTLSLLRAGDRVVSGAAVYGGTFRLFEKVLSRFGVETDFVDARNLSALDSALEQGARLLVLETPANPNLDLTDIEAAAQLGRDHGARVVVDNTFMTPVLQRPLDLGADIVLHSTTKYMDGHNATVGGALVTRDPALRARFFETRKAVGTIQSPFESWLTLQGLKTLPLRIRRQSESSLRIARWLASHPRIARVRYPFLESFPQRALAHRQQRAGGAIISFEVDGGSTSARRVADRLRLTYLAENLGASETLLTHPASMTHAAMPRGHRRAIGITDGLLRLSVGLEDPKDIIADLDQALAGTDVAESELTDSGRTELGRTEAGPTEVEVRT